MSKNNPKLMIEFTDAGAAGFRRARDLSEAEFAAALADERTQWWRPDGKTLLVRRRGD